MAQGHVHLDTETFSCPVCLDLLKDPVSLTCGHNYCLSCITDHWDKQDEKGIHSCPQCKEEFPARPELLKNTTLAAVVEQLKKTEVKAAPADDCCDAGAEDVARDVCTGQLQQLSLTEDRRRFPQHDSSAPVQAASSGSSDLRILPGRRRRFEEVTAAVLESGQKIRRLLSDSCANISPTGVEVAPAAEPTTREEFLRYSADLTLDPNTAHTRMLLSEGNTKATWIGKNQPYPLHPDRFTGVYCQVLSSESLTGRCYWEVKVREGRVCVAVSYKNISRAGHESGFGFNGKSWVFKCSNQSYAFWFHGIDSEVPGPWCESTVGVYLDHAAGLLSFYSVVSHSMTLLHRVHTSFAQPLHAGLGLCWPEGASCELVKLG